MDLFIHYTGLPEGKTINPKYAQMAVKNYLQTAQFPRDTMVEIGGMEIGIYE